MDTHHVPKPLRPEMDCPHQESPTIWSELPWSNAEEDQQVPSEWMEGQTDALNQSVLIEGHKPRLVDVGVPKRYCQGKAVRELILPPNSIQICHQ